MMRYTLKRVCEKPFLYCKDNIVCGVNEEFVILSGYEKDELIGKSINDIYGMLIIDSQVNHENIGDEYSCYMFTKELEPREVVVSCKGLECENEKKYFFKEKPNSRIEDRLPYVEKILSSGKIGVTILSYPELIHIKANQKILDLLRAPYNEKKYSIGCTLEDTLPGGYRGSDVEKVITDVVRTKEMFNSDCFELENSKKELRYYDVSYVPVCILGKVKYIVQTSVDVTEKILNRKLVEEKNRQLETIIDNVSDGVSIYNIEDKSVISNGRITKVFPEDSVNKLEDVFVNHKHFDSCGNEQTEENMHLLRALRTELEAIIESIPDGLYTIDKDLNIKILNSSVKGLVYESQSFNKFFDLSEYTKYYDSGGNLLRTEDFPQLKVLKGEKLNDLRVTAHRPDRIVHFSLSGSPIHDKDGNIEEALICVRDITEQVSKDELIKQQKEELEAIIENMSDGLVIIDKDYNQSLLNSSAKKIMYNSDSAKNVEDVLSYAELCDSHGNLLQLEDLPVSRVLKGEKIKGFRLTSNRPDGIHHFSISGSPIYDKNGNIEKALICIRNITDILKSQQAIVLKKQYDLLTNMVENLDLEYSRISYPEFKLKYMNSKSYNDFRLIDKSIVSPCSVIGRNVFELFNCRPCDIDMVKTNIKDIIDKKSSSCFFYNRHIVAGEEKFLKVMLQPLFNLNNGVTEIVSIAIDITDEVNAKNKVEKALKVQDEIFANVAHELKTPLNVIFSTNQLMELYLKNNSLEGSRKKISQGIHSIRQNCYRFTKLINNIVDISKIDSGFFKLHLSNENIVQVTEDIVQSVSGYIKEKGINIIFDTNTEEKIIACDPEKIERILLNLISNAIKFTNSDGKIFIDLLDKGETVEISVKDTGIGMDRDQLDMIFNRFHQVDKSLSRNAEGSGIGLDLVKSIVELHDGNISVDSKVGEGSIFKIGLPARTIEETEINGKTRAINNKIEMINIEFSDIYSV